MQAFISSVDGQDGSKCIERAIIMVASRVYLAA